MAKKSVKKPVKKAALAKAKKSVTKTPTKPARRSLRQAIDKSMAVVLQATGLDQLKPIRPSRKTAIRSKDEPTPR